VFCLGGRFQLMLLDGARALRNGERLVSCPRIYKAVIFRKDTLHQLYIVNSTCIHQTDDRCRTFLSSLLPRDIELDPGVYSSTSGHSSLGLSASLARVYSPLACDINRSVNGLQGLLEDIVQLFAIGIPSDASKSPVSSPTQPFVL
jgi:hypothetical protein